jgi:hypothetical protein
LATQLGNPGLQKAISARLARIDPDDRMTCAVNVTPPGLPSRSPSRAIAEDFVTQQTEATIRTNFEVIEVGAGLGW